MNLIMEQDANNIIIYSDSQAALAALENHKIKHKTVQNRSMIWANGRQWF